MVKRYLGLMHLTKLYKTQRSVLGLTLVPKLKFEHVVLTSFSKMQVDLAAQVSSYTDSKVHSVHTGSE